MILDKFIPQAYAQATGTAATSDLLSGAKGAESLKGIPAFIFSNLDNWIGGIVIVIVFFILAKIASNKARQTMIKSKGEEVQENALLLVERMTKFIVIVIGVTIALAINGLNFTAVIGALSLGIGFALKSFIENFISSIMMLSQNRIRIGDLIDVNGQLGRIITIDMRTTMIQALDGSMITIPNQTMLASVWTSYSAHPFRRMELLVGVAYETDLKEATSIVKGIISKYKDVAPKPEPTILVDEFAESSITIKVWFWVEITKPFFVIRSNVAYRIKKAFDKAGINITCPVRVIKIDEDDRVWLKTIDSIKKGIVPNAKSPATAEQMAAIANETENMQTVPLNVFEKPKAPEPVPVPVAPPTSMQKPQTDPSRKPVPPPTHL